MADEPTSTCNGHWMSAWSTPGKGSTYGHQGATYSFAKTPAIYRCDSQFWTRWKTMWPGAEASRLLGGRLQAGWRRGELKGGLAKQVPKE